jgi:hypothetical protein
MDTANPLALCLGYLCGVWDGPRIHHFRSATSPHTASTIPKGHVPASHPYADEAKQAHPKARVYRR